MDRTSRSVWRWAAVFVTVGLVGLVTTARAAVPPRGSEAPYFALDSIAGDRVELAQFEGEPVVLIFGDLRHEGAKKAAKEAFRVLQDDRLKDQEITPIFLTAEHSSDDEMAKLVADGRFPELVLHDTAREAFGAYHILVVPSVVIVDGEGIVVYAMPGFLPRFGELLTQSLLVATGQMTDEEFEKSIGVGNGGHETDPNTLRAERLVNLGKQLLGHDLADMAEARFREAADIDPGYAPARLALGELYRVAGKIEDAEAQYRTLLDTDPDSVEGRLGLARVQIDMGGEALEEAEKTTRSVLENHPKSARAHYQLGLILEARGDRSTAAASYRKAAELLLYE